MEIIMNNYAIVIDSASDLPAQIISDLDLHMVPLSVRLGEEEYLDYPDERGIAPDVFCEKLRSGVTAQTSAPSVESFVAEMEPLLKDGNDILYIGFSSTLSATYNVGSVAAKMLMAKYPERRIITIDSFCASLGLGLLIYLAAAEKRKGKTLDELAEFVENTKMNVHHWFTVTDLKFLKRGGRVSAAAATVGIVLHIKPIMQMDNEGHLTPVGKVRGREASLKVISSKVAELAVNPEEQTVFICQCGCEDDAKKVAEKIRTEAGVKEVIIGPIGPVISAHGGPGIMGVFFVGEHR